MAVAADDPNVPKQYRGMNVPGLKGKTPASPSGTGGSYSLEDDIREQFKGANARARSKVDPDVDIEGMSARGVKEAREAAKAHEVARHEAKRNAREWAENVADAGAGGNKRMKEIIKGTIDRIHRKVALHYEP